ncbi:hypothetical protein [Bacillus sp. H1a]|uniref:hypothetical protein n=1 Tax=Bacillus sp. H1a TaxID=1397276 RepID=UPI000468DD9B|nr:hypothetical protein [Bacillus sp. H1a]
MKIAVSEWKALKKETKLKLLRYAMLGVSSHAHQLKNSKLPQNEKMSFLLPVSTKFRSGGTMKF